jgi:RHS repeat-associated protein
VLTDATGAVTATFSYTPFGALNGKTGAADTALRWNGQYQDADTGLYYLRARYYDPSTAQFLTRDPLAELTRMAYGYAADNPLNLADPLGLDFLGISSQGWATIGLVAGGIALAATGVGLAVDAGIIAGATAETIGTIAGITATSGGLATMTDVVPCVRSFGSVDGPDGAACAGAVLGAASLGYGAPGVLLARLPRLTRGVLDAHALLFGSAALSVDAYAYREEYLEGCESWTMRIRP